MEQSTNTPCYNQQQIFDFISSITGQKNIIPVPVEFIRFTGDANTAMLLNQIIFWTDRTSDPEKWFYKSYDQWLEELALNKYFVSKSATILKSMELIETKVKRIFNGDTVLHYKLNQTIFIEKFIKHLEASKNNVSNDNRNENKKTLQSLGSSNFAFPEVQTLHFQKPKLCISLPLYTENTISKTTATIEKSKIEQKDVVLLLSSNKEFEEKQATILLELIPKNHKTTPMIEKFIFKAMKSHTPDEIKAGILYTNKHSINGDTEKYRSYLGLSLKNGWSDCVLESIEETNRLLAETAKAKAEAEKLKKEAYFNTIKKENEEKAKRKFQNEYLDNLKTNDNNKFVEIQNLALTTLLEERPNYKPPKDGLSVFLKMCKILGID